MNTEKVYVLKKDYENPSGKCHAGVSYTAKEWISRWFPKLTTEDFDIKDDWFSLKQQVEDKRIEVSKFCKFDTKNTEDNFYYQFCASKPIPKEFSEQICRAIEYVVNDVFEKIVPPTLERQESKKDWEIISYYHEGWIYKKNSMGEFIAPFNAPVHLLILHPDNMKIIHSVRRISDGEVFELHKVYYDEMDRNIKPIKKFFVKDSVMYAQFDEGRGSNDGCLGVNSLKKQPKEQPKPLFTTDGGVIYYEGEKKEIWGVYTNDGYNSVGAWHPESHPGYYPRLKSYYTNFFSTREAAEEWVLMNKPCLSVNDIVSASRNEQEGYFSFNIHSLKQLAKTKINKQ